MANKKNNKVVSKPQEKKPQEPVKVASPTTKPNISKKASKPATEPAVEFIKVQQETSQPKKKEPEQKKDPSDAKVGTSLTTRSKTKSSLQTTETKKPEPPKKVVPKAISSQKKPNPKTAAEEQPPLDSVNNAKRKRDTDTETPQELPKTEQPKRNKRAEKRKKKSQALTEAVPMEVDAVKETSPVLATPVNKDAKSTQIAATSENSKRKREDESEQTEVKVNVSRSAKRRAKKAANRGKGFTVEGGEVMVPEGLKDEAKMEEVESTKSSAENPSEAKSISLVDEDSKSLQSPSQKSTVSTRRQKKSAKNAASNDLPKEALQEDQKADTEMDSELNQTSAMEIDEAPTTDVATNEDEGNSKKDSLPPPKKLSKAQQAKLKKQAKKLLPEVEPKETPVESEKVVTDKPELKIAEKKTPVKSRVETENEIQTDASNAEATSVPDTKSNKKIPKKKVNKPVEKKVTEEPKQEEAVETEVKPSETQAKEVDETATIDIADGAEVGSTEMVSAPSPKLTKSQKAKLKKQAKKVATVVEPETQQESREPEPIAVTAEASQAQHEETAVETSKAKPKPKKKQAAKPSAQGKAVEKECAEEKAATPKDIDDIFANKKSKIAKTLESNEDDKCAMETFVNTITNVKAGKKSAKPKARIEDDGFADSRGSKSRRKTTDDGLPIYQDKELLAVGSGDTAECPFD